MASDLDLTDSAIGTVLSLLKRCGLLAGALLWGAMIGVPLPGSITSFRKSRALQCRDDELQDGAEATYSLYSLSKLSIVAEFLLAGVLIVFASIAVIRGSLALRAFLAAIVGAGYLAVTASKLSDWSPSLVTWILFALLVFHAWFLLSRLRAKRGAEFESHLERIRTENEARRSSSSS